MSSNIKSKEEYYSTTLVSGIVCKKCGIELPQMLMSEHLDINNPKNKMCGCIPSEQITSFHRNILGKFT
jgi:hypothetical protein